MIAILCWALTASTLGAAPALLDVPHWNADATADILKIGTFIKADQRGWPAGWDDLSAFEMKHARLQPEGPGIVTLSDAEADRDVSLSTTIDLPPNTEYVTFILRLRGLTLKKGGSANAGGGVTFSFVDARGRQRDLPRVDPNYVGYRDWNSKIQTAKVLAGEVRLKVSISLVDARGDFEVDNILVVPSDPRDEATFAEGELLKAILDSDDAEAIAKLIEDDPRMLELRAGWEDNGTPLVRAAWKGAPKVAARLIELGADIEATDYNFKNTPLRWTCWWGNHEVTAVLLRAGADTTGAANTARYAKNANKASKRTIADYDLAYKLVFEYEETQKKKDTPVRFAWFVDFSPNGKSLVAAYGGWEPNEGGEVRVWDVESGKATMVIASSRGVRAAAWSPKGTFFASGNYGGEVCLYDAQTGKVIRRLSSDETPAKRGTAELVQITPDERRIIVASGNGKIWIWETDAGKLVRTLSGHDADVWGMRLAPDGTTLATAGKDGTVRVWNIKTGEEVYTFAHPGTTNGVAFTSDSRLLATGCVDGQIRIWNLETGKVERTLQGHRGSINDFDFSSDDSLLASSGGDRTVRLWDIKSGKLVATLEGHTQTIYGVRFSPTDEVLASGCWDATVKLWDVAARKEIKTWQRQQPLEK